MDAKDQKSKRKPKVVAETNHREWHVTSPGRLQVLFRSPGAESSHVLVSPGSTIYSCSGLFICFIVELWKEEMSLTYFSSFVLLPSLPNPCLLSCLRPN